MPRQAAPSGRGSRSCDDDELSGRVIRFHGSVRLGNLIESETLPLSMTGGVPNVCGGRLKLPARYTRFLQFVENAQK